MTLATRQCQEKQRGRGRAGKRDETAEPRGWYKDGTDLEIHVQRIERVMVGVLAVVLGTAAGCFHRQPPAPPPTRADLDPQAVAALDWVDQHDVRLASVEPVAADSDLEPLKGYIGNAHVVGVGEATDGSHQFTTVNQRIFEMLARESGFRTLAIEAPVLETSALDDYVRTGVGDPKKLIADLGSWALNTQEMLQFVTWMRAYDAAHTGDQQVGLAGFDMEYPTQPTAAVLAFVDRTLGSEFRRWVYDQYWCTTRPEDVAPGQRLPPWASAYWNACVAAVVSVSDTLTEMHDRLVAASSNAAVDSASRMAKLVLLRALVSSGQLSRDAAMADNIVAVLDRLGPAAKVVVWSHDATVGRFGQTKDLRVGDLLGQRLHSNYFAIGYAFASGQFRSLEVHDGQVATRPRVFSVDLPERGSYEWMLQFAKDPDFYLDLRRTPTGDAGVWLTGPHPFRMTGWTYDTDDPDQYATTTPLLVPWDVLVFIRTITADEPR